MRRAENLIMSWKERKKTISSKWQTPLVFVEWNCDRFSNLLRQWAFLEILEYLGRFAILVAIIFWILESDDRRQAKEDQRKAKHYQAWQVINTARGQESSGGRIDALQDLVKDNVFLASIDISNAILPEINLANAVLIKANLSGTKLYKANLSEAKLYHVNLSGGAMLREANLSGALLWFANLSGVNLSGAKLFGTQFLFADLSGADLSGASLWFADLSGADLRNSKLRDIKGWNTIKGINHANIYGADIDPNSRTWAIEHGAVEYGNYDEWQNYIKEQEKKVR